MRSILLLFIVSLLAPSALSAKTLKLASPLNTPPYVLQGSQSGIELEITREVLRKIGYEVEWQFLPPNRFLYMVQSGALDGAIRQHPDRSQKNVFYSVPYIYFQNVAISVKKNNLKIATIKDLQSFSIATFQRASEILGEDFAALAKGRPSSTYIEVSDQMRQLKLLYSNRYQTIILERTIFEFFNRKFDNPKEVKRHFIFGPTSYSVAFAKPELASEFSEIFLQLKDAGEVQKIINKYIRGEASPQGNLQKAPARKAKS